MVYQIFDIPENCLYVICIKPGQWFIQYFNSLHNCSNIILTTGQWFLRYFDSQDNGPYVILTSSRPVATVFKRGCEFSHQRLLLSNEVAKGVFSGGIVPLLKSGVGAKGPTPKKMKMTRKILHTGDFLSVFRD